MTSRYHGSKNSGSEQPFLIETAIRIDERWKPNYGLPFWSCSHVLVLQSCSGKSYVPIFFSAIFAEPRFVEIQKFCYNGNVT